MKIIDEKPLEFKCSKCKTVFAPDPEDVSVAYFGANYGGDRPERQYYVECPVCGTDKILKQGEISPAARKLADQKEADLKKGQK